jgi:hypothetical protein
MRAAPRAAIVQPPCSYRACHLYAYPYGSGTLARAYTPIAGIGTLAKRVSWNSSAHRIVYIANSCTWIDHRAISGEA